MTQNKVITNEYTEYDKAGRIIKKTTVLIDEDNRKEITSVELTTYDAAGRITNKSTSTSELGVTKPVRPRVKDQVIFVLDKSGSMEFGKDLTIKSFNDQVEVIRNINKLERDVEVSLVTFDNNVATKIIHQEVGSVVPLNNYTYQPDGGTALLDAIGVAISLAQQKDYHLTPSNAVLIAIFTDGEENSSKLQTYHNVQELIKNRIGMKNWTFTAAGPSRSLGYLEGLGIPKGNIVGFTPESLISRNWAGSVHSAGAASYFTSRAAGATQTMDSYSMAMASVGADPSVNAGVKIHTDKQAPATFTVLQVPPPSATGTGVGNKVTETN